MEQDEINKESAEAPENTGSKHEAAGLIDGANAAAERLEKANAHQAELLKRGESLAVEQKLGGNSNAGVAQEIVKEETDAEYRQRIDQNIADGKYN